MRLLSPHFPAGRIGTGLLLLRMSVAVALLATPEITAEGVRWIGIAFAMALILGFWTRAAAVLCLGLLSFALARGADPGGSGAYMLAAAAILLLGAGAYSADAAMFGRRTIILQRGRD